MRFCCIEDYTVIHDSIRNIDLRRDQEIAPVNEFIMKSHCGGDSVRKV